MKTEFETRIYQLTEMLIPVLKMIAEHNSGKTLINLAVLEAHVKVLRDVGMVKWDCQVNDDMMVIQQNGKPALNIMLHTYIGSIDENNNVSVNNQNY